jgi:hypothetical protein
MLAAALALAGCAAQVADDPNREYVEKEYRTGSNLAVKRAPYNDGVKSVSKDDLGRLSDPSMQAPPMISPGTR